MDIKEFKKKIKNEEYRIPDVKDKIKESSIFKNREIEEELEVSFVRNRNWLRFSLSAAIIVLVAIISAVIFIPRKQTITYETSAVNYLKDTDELKELVTYYNENYTFSDVLIDFIDGFSLMKTYDVAPAINESNTDVYYMLVDGNSRISDNIVASSVVPSTNIKASLSSENEVSKTNTQVDNVDEADVVKSDGKSIYRVYEKNVFINDINNGVICDTKTLVLADDKYVVSNQDLYLTNDYIVVLFFSYKKVERKNWFIVGYSERLINVHVYDKQTLELKKQYSADYVSFNESRLVNGETDILYLVFNQSACKDGKYREPYYNEDNSDKDVNITDVCYFDALEKDNYTCIVSIKLDKELTLNESVTLGPDYWNGMYVNENSIYLYDIYTEWEITTYLDKEFSNWTIMSSVTRYSIDNGEVKAVATLATSGEIISQFALDEYNGYLRMVTSESNKNKLEIYNLNKIDEEYQYELVGSITKGLGEKNEVIKSVDFNKDECIVVTAKQTDPMYKIDLSNPKNPRITGKFKEPGYNSYLQYLTGDLTGLAIGVGYQTHDISEYYNVRDNTKFGLYDVTGDSPKQISLIEYEVSYMEACDNHKAIFVYKNYVGFEAKGVYHLYEIVKTKDSYKVEERLAYSFNKNMDYYDSNISRMYYVNGYFYLSYIDAYNKIETGVVSFDSNYIQLNEVGYSSPEE